MESPEKWKEAGYLHRLDGSIAPSRNVGRRKPPLVPPAPVLTAELPKVKPLPALDVWGSPESAAAAFEGLPLASANSEAAAFLQRDYGLAPGQIPPQVRCWAHPGLGPGLVYHVRDVDGDGAYFFRSLSRDRRGKRDARWLLGNEGVLTLKGAEGRTLVIVSGAEKGIAAAAAGFRAMAFMNGEQQISNPWVEQLVRLRPPRIVLANDADETGKKANAATARALELAGLPAGQLRIVQWPKKARKGEDLNDVLKEGGLDGLRRFIEAAAPAPSVLPPLQSAAELQVQTFRPPRWIIEGLRPEGLSMIAARPKKGKSWLELACAISIASGTPALGHFPTTEGDVLYLALEDSSRRIQSRMAVLLGEDHPWPSRLHFAYQWPRLDQGGLAQLGVWLRSNPGAAQVVIDTFTRVKPPKGRDAESYHHDSEVTAGLQRLALEHNVAIVLIHHQRKADADDIFDSVSGTNGLTASADVLLILENKQGRGKLSVTGRDLALGAWALTFDGGRWTCTGEASSEEDDGDGAHSAAQDFLTQLLKDGPVDSGEVMLEAKRQGFTPKQMYTAKKALALKATKTGFKGGWRWSLP